MSAEVIMENKNDRKQSTKDRFPVTGMSCASCSASVESILNQLPGVHEASVNFANTTATVEFDNSLISEQELQAALQAVGYDLILGDNDSNALEEQEDRATQSYQKALRKTIWAAVLTLPVFILGMFYMHWVPGRWISLPLSAIVLFWFGRDFFIGAYRQAKFGKANMDTLVALSTGIAFFFSLFNTFFPDFFTSRGFESHVYYEAATVIITFISLGKLLEERAKSNTSSAIKKLIGLQPKTMRIVEDGIEMTIPIEQVKQGQRIVIKPGEKIPVDGSIIAGDSFVDESMITGEPIAVHKTVGDALFAGTINQKGSFQFEAEKVGQETLLAQIIQMVQEAQGSKAPVQRLVDKIAGVFVPTVIVIAIITFTAWMILGGQDAFFHALLNAIAVLVIACPCALGLATPTAIMVGIGKGAEHNILIKDAESLELGYKVNAVILDKTGTITEGHPEVQQTYWTKSATSYDKGVLRRIEEQSEHPLAEAIIKYLEQEGTTPKGVTNFNSITGKGVRGTDDNGVTYFVGNFTLVEENDLEINAKVKQTYAQWSEEGMTVIFFANQKTILGILGITDKVKPSSAKAIAQLQKRGIAVHMLTGDNAKTAAAVSEQVGITKFRAEVMPSDKADYVKLLQEEGHTVAMVGDGINDSQALAQADVSIAMGKGSDIAIDVAKMTLITSDLMAIPKALKLSKKTVIGIRQNLFWAFIYNLIGIPIAAGLLYPINGFELDPMIAGAAMALSSVSVVANSLRLKQIKI
ncbi:heavy metal translocating P-type ATPase [Phaeodactylibacter sp.]|uniref:heavy metal translocating P-type ATPase n=1 Tax=Phaeodactylibacter sp. TaxID=1940289 RepID=UPI0025E0E050|nr:heavy metal translocating P-type ATPase [Phaeodactylibacter sp.]MCI5091144.1 heavy metal translocating P-type ATPase [Phaeodactylibacter sp.]